MTLTQIQRALDRRILQTMEQRRDHGYKRTEYGFGFSCFVSEPELTRDMVRQMRQPGG